MSKFIHATKPFDSLVSTPVADATSKEWGRDNAFGDMTPGNPLPFRARKFLAETCDIAERMLIYATVISPRLRDLHQDCAKKQVPFSETQMHGYLRSYEKALIQSYLFERRTHRAVPIHGFFPYDMPKVDQQDRILALTSVTMHGWNALRESGFRRDIEAAIPFLVIGGKYILGPVNQHVYFGGYNSDFDAQGLCTALQSLEEEGKIAYYFVVGQRQSYNEFGSIERQSNKPQVTAKSISNYESATSLVITRLK